MSQTAKTADNSGKDAQLSLRQYLSRVARCKRKIVRRFILRPVLKFWLNVRVDGEKNVANLRAPFIVVANHSSHLDAPVLFARLPDQISYTLATGAAADYFYRHKVISHLTALFFNTYPVKRRPVSAAGASERSGAGAREPKRPGISSQLLQAGVPLLIFPEGTRSRSGSMAEFKPGTAALALKMDCPIVPVGLSGNRAAMPVGAALPSRPPTGRHQVVMTIGEPMRPRPGEAVKDFNDRVYNRVIELVHLSDQQRQEILGE